MTRTVTAAAKKREARFEYLFMRADGEQLAKITALVERSARGVLGELREQPGPPTTRFGVTRSSRSEVASRALAAISLFGDAARATGCERNQLW